MIERYYLGAYWGPRNEDVDRCARRLVGFLEELTAIGPALRPWYRTGRKRAALELDPTTVRKLLLAGRTRSDLDNRLVEEDLGFRMGLWNGGRQVTSVGLSISCGKYFPDLVNAVVMQLPDPREAEVVASGLFGAESLHAVMKAIATYWEPDQAVIISSVMRDEQDSDVTGHVPYVGPLTYLSAARPLPPVLPNNVIAENLGVGTILTIESDLGFTEVSIDDVRALRESLASAGSLYPTATS